MDENQSDTKDKLFHEVENSDPPQLADVPFRFGLSAIGHDENAKTHINTKK